MHCLVCIDDHGGMMFHRRRQSRDRAVCADIMRVAVDSRLWMNDYSRRQFSGEEAEAILVEEHFLDCAGPGDWCFVEDQPLRPWLDRIESMTVYRWNRVYPADFRLDIFPWDDGWTITAREEFSGHSHPTITKEVYVK